MFISIFTHSYNQAFYKVIGHDKKFLVWKMCFYYVLLCVSCFKYYHFSVAFLLTRYFSLVPLFWRLGIYPANSCSKSGRVSPIVNECECFKVMSLAVCLSTENATVYHLNAAAIIWVAESLKWELLEDALKIFFWKQQTSDS